jgi:hypothetical protein
MNGVGLVGRPWGVWWLFTDERIMVGDHRGSPFPAPPPWPLQMLMSKCKSEEDDMGYKEDLEILRKATFTEAEILLTSAGTRNW